MGLQGHIINNDSACPLCLHAHSPAAFLIASHPVLVLAPSHPDPTLPLQDGDRVDELDPSRGPLTQQELVAAYMTAMRAGRAVGVAVGAGARGGVSPTAHLHRPGSPEAAAPHPHDTSLTAVAAVAAASASKGEEGGGGLGRGDRGGRVRGAGGVGQQEAAVRIQAAFRGHRTRRDLRKAGVTVKSAAEGRKLVTGAARAGGRGGGTGAGVGVGGGGKRQRPMVPFMPQAEYGPEHERAATKIQAAVRGRAARKRAYEQRRSAMAAAREAEATSAAGAASPVATGAAQGGRQTGSVAGPTAARAQQQQEQQQRSGPPAAAVKPSVLSPAGVPYGAQHEVAAARIQASWKGRKVGLGAGWHGLRLE